MITPEKALERLMSGNRRFVRGETALDLPGRLDRRKQLASGQAPFAIVLACSDSRLPVEAVFDQDVGDLFVVRVAGNIVGQSQMGSVEFAAAQFGTRLVVVLGHSRCSAVDAALRHLEQPAAPLLSPNLEGILEHIRPALEPLVGAGATDRPELLARAVRANIRAMAARLRNDSRVLRSLIDDGGLRVVGAEYSLATGAVDVFDGLP